MTNLTPTTELKFALLPAKKEAWYCLSFSDTDETVYVYGSQKKAKKYQDLMGERHCGYTNYLPLYIVTDPELLAELEDYP